MSERYVLSEDDLEKIIEAIPGETLMHKLWGAVTVWLYVALRTGLRPTTIHRLTMWVLEHTAHAVSAFEDSSDVDAEINKSLDDKSMRVKTGKAAKDYLTNTGETSSSFTFTPNQDDFEPGE